MNRLAKKIFEANKKKGFWTKNPKDRNFGEVIALCHSELSEALEADRKGTNASLDTFEFLNKEPETMGSIEEAEELFKSTFKTYIKDTKEDELADTIIRVLDYCGAMDIDIDRHIELKLRYNETRGNKHGKRF